jgi:hypothetical protein
MHLEEADMNDDLLLQLHTILLLLQYCCVRFRLSAVESRLSLGVGPRECQE